MKYTKFDKSKKYDLNIVFVFEDLKEIASILFVDIKNIDLMKKALDIKPITEEIKEKFRERLMKLGDFSSL